MDESKEKAILMAAVHEFAVKGFDQASTNQMARSAGVSKGLIFHYFESKEKLFEASVDYALKFTLKELDYENWHLTKHVIADIKQICEAEFRFYKTYPDIYRFILSALIRPPKTLSVKMKKLFRELMDTTPAFVEQTIDRLDLKEGVDREVLKAVLVSHYDYYAKETLGYFKTHPGATFEEIMPYVDKLLAMLTMSLHGLVKNDEDLK
ncbi:TetR/AcrR family transcriptional regulator [Sporolactobacillus sp. THM19-2]|jgi:AcrR family transcriptional regulator|uniref:TetR/AcrR family transcriptional regulator n=1 Tax=Sporolactobacillus sp. THM19-2 TaxID=2511171 RepID=UPI00101F65CF|nr:TetR/AcrR family transcriptional regulator [Sporolactobacillus sp. THM19-2]RYL90932.1 TetR/AcrR family transcriptional regulator [Sporolactobacillus sp. THM19-2]